MSMSAPDNKKNLQSWLEGNKSENEVSNILFSLGMLNLLLRKNGIIHNRLFEIDSVTVIDGLAEDIKRNNGLRIHSKNRRFAAVNAIYAYKEYLESKNAGEKSNSEDNAQIQQVSFTERKDYSYTRPLSVEYCGNTYAVKNWTVLYVQTVKCLFENYPDAIQSLIGKNIGERGRVDITDVDSADNMIAPKEINKNLYLETNCSAASIINKISQLLDICNVDYTSVVIKYVPKDTVSTKSPAESNDDELMRIKATLELPRFEYGFRDDGVELYRFRTSYADIYDSKCPLDDDQLLSAIRKMGFEFDGKVYLISGDKLQAIEYEIRKHKDQGVNIIYYDELYERNSDKYFEEKIVSAEMLKKILKSIMPEFKYRSNYFALLPDRQTEFELTKNDIIRVWGDNTLQTFDDLSMKLPLIPINKIKFTLAQQAAFVWNSAETYLQADWFEASRSEIDRLVTYIEDQCEEHGRVSLDEIPFDNLKAENLEFSEPALSTCFCRLVEDRFDRNARILTRKGASIDTYTAVIEFCQRQDMCTYNRLVHIAEKVTGTISTPNIIGAANAVMVRVNKEEFIADRLINFDVDRIDSALDYIITDDFMGMREITTFSTFPFCEYGWNLFLLESYCRRFSKNYRYDTRRANSSNSGAVVAKACHLSYHDIMAKAVARSERDLNKDDVFDFLAETGYIERRKYSNIDLLISKATKLRERRT